MRTFLVFNKEGAVMEIRSQEKEPLPEELQAGGTAIEFEPQDGDTNPNNYKLVDGKLTHVPPAVDA
jgi:hypothetical protein